MDKRAKLEQFRKRKNNFFHRGYDIRVVYDTEVFILFKRNGKFYTFANTEELVWPTEEDIQHNLVISKTAADYETTSRAKEKASKANATTSCPSYASEDMSTLPLLRIKTPESPRLDLSSQHKVRGTIKMPKETKSKGASKRVAPVTSVARNIRKQEVRGKIRETTLNVEKHRNNVAEKKAKLEELSKIPLDSSRPGERVGYDNLKAEIAKLDGELIEWEGELEKLNKEDKDIDIERQEDSDGEELFVPPGEPGASSNNTTRLPPIDLTEPNGTSKPLIISEPSEDEEAVFTPAQRQQDRLKPVIVRYSPQNAAKYERFTATKEDDDFDEEGTEQFSPDHRLRDLKVAKKFVRRRRELLGITGLAYNCDLKDLEPKEKGETRRVTPLKIRVKWEIGGVIQKTWEVRSSIRHLFSNAKKCDVYIYDAAKWHAARHEEWQNSQREAKDRSPTLALNSRLSPTPELKQLEIKIKGGNSGNPPTATNNTASSKAS
ncbi:hypothetical protein BKA61DRAFT_681547 [Leptodontidium sp. MPI-SDFR-AT-0119]|nr:hypothetical protein BKA61DRAFT_681547 [Leptodontidium sp. MPI-SDFR-AT-0119]